MDSHGLEDKVGDRVVLIGVATDYKAGAAVVLDGGFAVLLDGVDYWEPARRGGRVEVSGTLRHAAARPPTAGEPHVQRVNTERWWLEAPKVTDAP